MASPVDSARATTNITTAADPLVVNLPTLVSGNLSIVFVRCNNGNGLLAAVPSGWTALVQDEVSDASNDVTHVFYRQCDGTEGTTLSVDITGTCKAGAVAYKITGHINPATQAPQKSTVAVGTGADADPGSVTPTGGSKDYLFLALAGLDGETQTYTLPTNYVNLAEGNSGTGGTPDTNVRLGAGSRQLTAASEDPGAFTNAAPSLGWTAYTIAVHPAAGGASVTGSADLAMTFQVDSTGLITPKGVADLPLAFSIDSVGRITPKGVVDLPLTFQIDTTGLITPKGVVDLPLSFVIDTNGVRAIFGVVDLGMTLQIDALGVPTFKGASDFPISVAIDSTGRITPKGAADLALLVDMIAAGKITAKGSLDLPLLFDIYANGTTAGSAVALMRLLLGVGK